MGGFGFSWWGCAGETVVAADQRWAQKLPNQLIRQFLGLPPISYYGSSQAGRQSADSGISGEGIPEEWGCHREGLPPRFCQLCLSDWQDKEENPLSRVQCMYRMVLEGRAYVLDVMITTDAVFWNYFLYNPFM